MTETDTGLYFQLQMLLEGRPMQLTSFDDGHVLTIWHEVGGHSIEVKFSHEDLTDREQLMEALKRATLALDDEAFPDRMGRWILAAKQLNQMRWADIGQSGHA